MSWIEEKEDCVIICVRVIPRASSDSIAGLMGDEALKVRIQAPPVDGKANAHLIRFLSKQWKIPRGDLALIAGETGRSKRIRIANPSAALREQLSALKNS